MKVFEWNLKKNEILKKTRSISFEDIVIAISENKILDISKHHNQKKYPNQKILIVEVSNYAYLVPFVESKEKIFLKTIIPNKKATKNYILKIKNEKT